MLFAVRSQKPKRKMRGRKFRPKRFGRFFKKKGNIALYQAAKQTDTLECGTRGRACPGLRRHGTPSREGLAGMGLWEVYGF